jgi:hypothetical protein
MISPVAAQQVTTLQGLINKLQLLKYTRGSIARSPLLSATAQTYWEREREEGEWVRENETVQDIARKTGFGFNDAADEPKESDPQNDASRLRRHAATAVQSLLTAFRPSDFWKPPATEQG